jgi:hypothetical protein
MAPSHLLPPVRTAKEETLMGAAGRRSSPRGFLQPWGGDEGTRLDRTTLERGGSSGFASGMRICMPAMEDLDRVLHGVVVLAFLGQDRGRVRLVQRREVDSCKNKGQGSSRTVVTNPSSLQT